MLPPPTSSRSFLVDDTARLAALDEGVHSLVNILNAVSSRKLHADTRLALRHNLRVRSQQTKLVRDIINRCLSEHKYPYRVAEANDVDTALEHVVSQFRRKTSITKHHRRDRGEASGSHAVAEVVRVGTDLVNELGRLGEHLEDLERGADYRRTQRVGEEVRARTLTQQVHDLLAAGSVSARAATKSLAQSRVDHVHLTGDAAVFVTAASSRTEEARGVALVKEELGVVLLGQRRNLLQRRDITVHAEDAIGGDESRAAVLRVLELLLQVLHVHVLEAMTLGLAEPDAVDDAGVVELIGEYGVFLVEHSLEETSIGVKARRVQDGVLSAVEGRDGVFQLLVDVLRAADEAHGAEAKAAVF
ncbi:hypothetical protein GQ600_13683 [Phytophthora cactorum]|nr:hypothetical protein GQ600_13683 [Phytophthora cactorum]